MIVVDTNVIAYLLMPGDHTECVEKLYRQDTFWVAPVLWKDEFINILCTYERVGRLKYSDCLELIKKAEVLMENGSFQLPAHRIMAVAHRTQCSGYDSQFIALSEDLGARLYTFDNKIVDAYSGAFRPDS